MDEQAGLQEHQRTASVPPNPHATPPNHPRQSRESAGATGKKAGAATRRLQRSSRGSNSNWRARVVWSNQCTVLCLFRRAPRTGLGAHLVHTREGPGKVVAIPWTQLDGVLVPLNCLYLPFLPLSLTHTQTRTHSPMFARAWWKRLSADGCLLGPRVLEGGLWGTPMRQFVYLRYKQCLWQRWWYKEANTEFMLCWLYPFFHSFTFLCKPICIFSFLFLLTLTFLIASGTLIKCQMIESLRHFLCLPFRNLSQHGSRWWQTVLASLQGGWRPLSNQLCLLNQIKKHNHVYWDFQIKSDKAFLFPEL